MGQAKSYMLDRETRGAYEKFKAFVCNKHIKDKGILKFINQNSFEGKCSYCEEDLFEEEDVSEVVSLVELAEYIVACIKMEYDDPANWLGYDSSEGGYQGEVYNTSELFFEIGLDVDNDDLLKHITDSIIGDQWCEKDPYGDSVSDELFFTWSHFSEILKHRSRFVFFKKSFKRPEDMMEPYEILDKIGEVVNGLKNLYNTYDYSPLFPTKDFYRARQHKNENEANTASTLGSPPRNYAMVNRMSPAGIPMFYCSDVEETAIAEVLDKTDVDKKYITSGCFQNTRPLNIINLNHLNRVSIFELDKNEYYHAMQFLWRFRKEISQPISRDGAEHYEYVPTQVVTEYFRDVFSKKYEIQIDGIQYPSVKNKGTSCFVLFFEQEDIVDSNVPKTEREDSKEYTIYRPKEPSLVLLNETVKTKEWQ
jgi:hypothetical protein